MKDREYLVQSLLDITDIKNLMKKQEISIDLAKHLLYMTNGVPPRHTPLSNDLILFAEVISVPCFKEGGDHYFVRNIAAKGQGRHEKTVVSLKDQSGHEVGCVLRSIITDLIHHEILSKHEMMPLEAVISGLNDAICRSDAFEPRDFFTSANAEIDHQTLEMRYLSTGHPRFFLIRGNEIKGLPERGKSGRNTPVPLNAGTAYSAASCQLEAGDKLIFYTDGLTDMPRANKKRFITFEELKYLIGDMLCRDFALSVSDIMRGILKAVSKMSDVEVIPFSKNTSDDDITILCLEIENRNAYNQRILRPGDSDELSEIINELYKEILYGLKRQGFVYSELGVRSVLTESMINAWTHGNQQDSRKSLTVRWRYGNDFHLEIIDEGDGFDFSRFPDPKSEENLTKASGRGLYIIRRFSDTVHWEEGGRHLILSLRKHRDSVAKVHLRRKEHLMKL